MQPETVKIFAGINDTQLQTWHTGKVYYSDNNGQTWSEVNFGQSEDRFIYSIFVNPFNLQEIWVSEGPLYNQELSQPLVYKSDDGGKTWKPVIINVGFDSTQVRVIGASSNGTVYISGGGNLFHTNNGGASFTSINPPIKEMTFVDFTNIAVHPDNPSILFLPLRAGGIARSENGGNDWHLINKGISNTYINLLAADPVHPSIVYAASTGGEGTFRSDDYGENWVLLNAGGIVHPWGDELTVDPVEPNNVWFISDVPYIHKSSDRGNTWNVYNQPYLGGNFNFCSVYAMSLSSDGAVMYALNNGFGIFKGTKTQWDWNWTYLNLSEIDYTYSLAIEPGNSNILYSGYNRKPFENSAKIMASYDGGEKWFTSLEVEGAEAITSVAIDPSDVSTLYAGATGLHGNIYISHDKGSNWDVLNPHFIMCTVWGQPQLIVDPDDPNTAYTATWLAGTWKTTDAGANWTLLDDAPPSSTALSMNSEDHDVIYLADRTAPKIWKTSDAGAGWNEIADFTYYGAFLVNRVLADGDVVYASTFGPGLHGGKLYKSENAGANWTDITGNLPRSVLDIAVDPANKDIIYVTTHIYGAYKSVDGGSTWEELNEFPDIGAYDIEIDPVEPSVLYTCGMGGCTVPNWCMEPDGYTFTDDSGVYKSTDSGSTWEKILTTGNECRAIRIHPDNHTLLFAAAMDDGLQVSTDGGSTWNSFNSGLDTYVLTSCAIADDKIYAGSQACGVYAGDIDTNGLSVAWQRERSNKPVPEVYSLEIKVDPGNSNRIYVGSNPGGLYRSDDGGETFYDKNFLTPSVVVEDPLRQGYYTFAINPDNPDEVWLGTWGKGIYKSYDGMDFDISAHGTDRKMYGKYITQIVIDPTFPNVVYAGTSEGVFKTSNGGQSWVEMNQGLGSTDVRSLVIHSNGDLYAGTKGYGIYIWDGVWERQNAFGDWGVIWPMWNDRPMYQYTSLLIHPVDNSRMMLGTFPQGIYRSTDYGITWRESNTGWTMDGVFRLVCHPNNPETVYSGTYNGLNISHDFGEHWQMCDTGWPDEQWVFSIDFDPTNPDIMYACSKNGENEGTGDEGFRGTVMKSVNGGESWYTITNGLDVDQEFYNIIVDKFDPGVLYLAAQHDGMFISRDAGNTWNQWNEGLTNHTPGTNGNNVTNTVVLSADHSILYFGSAGSGVFRRMITPILPVNNISADVEFHEIILQWQFDDLSNNFSHYNIYRSNEYFSSLENMSPYASSSSLTGTFTDTNVLLGEQYYYAVTTNDNTGYENDHIYVLGPVVDHGIMLTPPSNFQISDVPNDQGHKLKLTWDPPPEEEQGFVQYYLIYRSRNSELTEPIPLAEISTIDSLAVMEEYYTILIDSVTAGVTEYIDEFVPMNNISYHYWIQAVSEDVSSGKAAAVYMATGIDEYNFIFRVNAPYPNPFNPLTTIEYEIPDHCHVKVVVYDILGREVSVIQDGMLSAGTHTALWNGENQLGETVGSGVYFYQLTANHHKAQGKIMFLRYYSGD